jgi:Ca-activated chloride channel homolog
LRAGIVIVLILCGVFTSLPARSQDTPVSPPIAEHPLVQEVELVIAEVSVRDQHGVFRGDLDRTKFRILDNGIEQRLAYFSSADEPTHVAVLIETSPAVYLIQGQHVLAAYALLDGLAEKDQVALATYDQSARVALDFTSDRAAVTQALDGVQYFLGMGDLNFYDSLNATLVWLRKSPTKRALVVLSTGLDSSPESRWSALQTELRKTDVSVFTVALGGTIRNLKSKKPSGSAEASFHKADKALREIAKDTGGQSYFPKNPDDFVAAYREISSQLRHEYLLGYYPPPHDGKVHSIEVRVVDAHGRVLGSSASANGFRVFSRQSYLSPEK